MTPIADAPANKATAKLKDCLRWAQIRTSRRDWLPESNLTIEYLDQMMKRQAYRCALTNLPLTLKGPQSATIDRIDGKRGYVQDNVRWVAKFANSAKSSMSDEDFNGWWSDLRRQLCSPDRSYTKAADQQRLATAAIEKVSRTRTV